MIKLVATFLNEAGKKHNCTFKDTDTNKSPEEIEEALELLTSLTIFEKDGVGLFEEVVSAKYVETIETPIFAGEEFFSDPGLPITLNQACLCLPWQEQTELILAEAIPTNSSDQIDEPKPHDFQKQMTMEGPANLSPKIESPVNTTQHPFHRLKENFLPNIRRKTKTQGREAPTVPPD